MPCYDWRGAEICGAMGFAEYVVLLAPSFVVKTAKPIEESVVRATSVVTRTLPCTFLG